METSEDKDKTDKPQTSEVVSTLFPIPIKNALRRVAENSGLLLSTVIRMVVLRHIAEDFPEFSAIAHEETEAFKQKLSETK